MELAKIFMESGVLIMGIQEHRIVHTEPIKIEKFVNGTSLITASAWRNGRGAAVGGVGFMVTKNVLGAITLIKFYGGRIITCLLYTSPSPRD